MFRRTSFSVSLLLVGVPAVGAFAIHDPPTTQPAVPSKIITEHGKKIIRFIHGKGGVHSVHVTFKNQYRRKPLVFVSDSDSTRGFFVIKAEAVTSTGCQITARLLGKDDKDYTAKPAYIVIGYPIDKTAEDMRDRLPAEFGAIILHFEKNKDVATTDLNFRYEYKSDPLVFLTECDTAGTFVAIKATKVTRRRCKITGRMIDRWSPTYRARIVYMVIGEIDQKQVNGNHQDGNKQKSRGGSRKDKIKLPVNRDG